MDTLTRFLSVSRGSLERRPGLVGSACLAMACAALLPSMACSAAAIGGDGSGGSSPAPGADRLYFVPSDTLLLAPGDVGELAVRVEPPGFHSVSFSLVANPSDVAFDGFLEAANVVSDDAGLALNEVQAPSSAAVFVVRASVDGTLFATRTVSVSTEGFATLVITPAYTGVRDVDAWTAVASLGVTCSELASVWEDGVLQARGDADVVTLSGVPVGPDVALVVRAGHYAGGCVSLSDLGVGEVRELDVPVTDRPVQLSDASFALTLDVEERTESFVDLLGQAAVRASTDYAHGYGEDADVFVNDCAEALASEAEREAFWERAEQYGYADIVRGRLPSPTVLRDVVLSQLVQAATYVDGPAVWNLSAELDGASSTLVLAGAAGVPAAVSGFLGSSVLSVVREAGDRLVLGADLEFQATRWLGAIAQRRDDLRPLALLQEAVECPELAADWLEAADGELYPDCDLKCAADLCLSALHLGWDRARTTAKDLTTLRIGVSGDVRIDDEARPVGLSGDWVGSIDSSVLSVAGTASSPSDEVP